MAQAEPLVPALTLELAYRLERAHVDFTRERLQGIREIPGNPSGVEIRIIDGAVAGRVAAIPSVDWMNMVMGLRAETEPKVAEILEPYVTGARNCWVETMPGALSPTLSKYLVQTGFTPLRFHVVLYGTPASARRPVTRDVDVRVAKPEEIETFLDLFLRGFEFPEAAREGAKVNMRHWRERGDWTLYIGSVAGKPAAAAVLYTAKGVGYMAAAGTAPESRGAGLQAAMLYRRIQDAAANGCDLIAGQSYWGTVSLRNQQRAGLQVGYTKIVWHRPGAA